MIRNPFLHLLTLSSLLSAQAGEGYDQQAACEALCRKADAGGLTVPLALEVLGGRREAEARTVAAIVRHEWAELPDAFLDGLDRDPEAARRFLLELARGLGAFEAACLGVHLHGAAGDRVARERGEDGLIASDLCDALAKELT